MVRRLAHKDESAHSAHPRRLVSDGLLDGARVALERHQIVRVVYGASAALEGTSLHVGCHLRVGCVRVCDLSLEMCVCVYMKIHNKHQPARARESAPRAARTQKAPSQHSSVSQTWPRSTPAAESCRFQVKERDGGSPGSNAKSSCGKTDGWSLAANDEGPGLEYWSP